MYVNFLERIQNEIALGSFDIVLMQPCLRILTNVQTLHFFFNFGVRAEICARYHTMKIIQFLEIYHLWVYFGSNALAISRNRQPTFLEI